MLHSNYSYCVCIRNASNKLQLKEKQAMRVCLLHPCDFCKAEIRGKCGEPMTDLAGFVS